jgi:hypothetical protein
VTTYIGPITDTIINQLSTEIQKKTTKDKIIKNILDPILSDIASRYYPHLLGVTVTLTIIIVLLLSILYINIYYGKCQQCSHKIS